MSMADKAVLMRKISDGLNDTLSVSQLNAVMQSIAQTVNNFEVSYSPKTDDESTNTKELIEEFLSAKAIEGCSSKTIEHYRYCINRLMNSIKIPINNVNVFHIRKYLMETKEAGSSDRTIEGYRAIFSSMFGWLHKEGLLQSNPCANISPIKCVKKIRNAYSQVDVESLLECCKNTRDKCIVRFLLCTGCRISEVCALNKDDIDFRSKECKVLGKGAKERTVYIDEITVMLLQRYLHERTDNFNALFIGKGTDRMTPGGIRFMLKKLEEVSGIENVHPHRFRRTLATNLINHGMPIQEVACILGHDKIDTTLKYVCISQDNVKNAYNKYA
jgi:site-specific recombinase XerD